VFAARSGQSAGLPPAPESLRVGIDTGGTFTDFVLVRNGRLEVLKTFSTPQQPELAILDGLDRLWNPARRSGVLTVGAVHDRANRRLLEKRAVMDVMDRAYSKEGDFIPRPIGPAGSPAPGAVEVLHGSTVATNALLERKGARVALVTTAGFEDVLAIGRQTRRELYNIFVRRPEPLAPEALRFGVAERVVHDGSVELPLDAAGLGRIVDRLRESAVESAAVCLLYSYANPAHEEAIRRALAPLGIPVSLSSKILPEYREYERASTTVINAYLAPRMGEYLTRLRRKLRGARLRVMQSNGGVITASVAAAAPVRTIVSGPAGGVVGALHAAALAGHDRVITFDMGGTSTDAALCDGDIAVTHEAEVDGFPVGIPMIGIHTVGAGGGSIAELDAGGSLQVGPQSAGAVPGPICYGRGGKRLTVTDANVILGRLPPRFFLGGSAPLAVDRIRPAVSALPWAKRWRSIEQLAQGVVDVVNHNMEQALRLISVERGHDPRDFALVSFGGAGGLHAAELARALGIPRVFVPAFPGALSALGLLLGDTRRDYSRSLLIPVAGAEGRIRRELAALHRQGAAEMKAEGFGAGRTLQRDFVDLRYLGQAYELTVPLTRDVARRFHDLHKRTYGYADTARPVELVNVRASFIGLSPKLRFKRHARVRGVPRPLETAPVWFSGRPLQTAIYDRAGLGHGQTVRGPAVIGEYSATTLVPPDFRCEVDERLNLILKADGHAG
jgi:N-methylhydantoinase A/oxoprolinase/acetone carboxylase beta subunit